VDDRNPAKGGLRKTREWTGIDISSWPVDREPPRTGLTMPDSFSLVQPVELFERVEYIEMSKKIDD
jgi:hypothetical protein